MSEVITDTDVHTIEWDDELNLPVFTWNRFVSGETFREHAREWERVMEKRDVSKYIVNTEAVTAHDDEDKRWLAETWIPDLIEIGVEYGAGIYADSVIADMDMSEIEDQLSGIDPSYEFRVFEAEDEAKGWLRNQ